MSSPHYLTTASRYLTLGRWGADQLTPSQIAAGVLDMLKRSACLVPVGQQWFVIDSAHVRYVSVAEAGPNLPALVAQGRWPGDFGETDADRGYHVNLFTLDSAEGPPSGRSLHVSVTAGSTFGNTIRFEIGDLAKPPDYSRLGYQSYRDMLGAIADAWPCPWLLTYNARSRPPVDASVSGPAKPPLGGAWIAYLSAPLIAGLTPPADLVAEPTAGGGLFLSAAQTLLDQSNTDDMRRSRLLEGVMRARVGLTSAGLLPSTPVRVGPA